MMACSAGSTHRRSLLAHRAYHRLYRLTMTVMVTILIASQAACVSESEKDDRMVFRLLTGTENMNLQATIDRFAEQENIIIDVTHQGSVDTMLDLQQGASEYDAVWPASSVWLTLGDTQRVVSNAESIMRTPVVFGVKREVASRLGWIGTDVTVEDILAAAEAGDIRYMTTSATQSNSGAMAYLGYLYAFAGHPDVLTSEMLHDPEVLSKTRRILNLVDRTAGASGFLRDLFLEQYDQFEGMVNNESAIIAANQQLVAEGRDPLYVIYPVDGLAIADWPLGFVDHGDPAKADLFARFQEFVLSGEVQAELLAQGRRVGLGLNSEAADPAVFNPDWGIDLERVIDPITIPPAEVVLEALNLYQTALRKPSLTVYLLDYSGSMSGTGEEQLEASMHALLDPVESAKYLLQPSAQDITIVIPFNSEVLDEWRVDGNDPDALFDLLTNITDRGARGGTNIYDPVLAALRAIDGIDGARTTYAPAIILMSDGQSDTSASSSFNTQFLELSGDQIPIYPILFADASEDQVTVLAESSSGRVFDGRTGLINAFRQARGYN